MVSLTSDSRAGSSRISSTLPPVFSPSAATHSALPRRVARAPAFLPLTAPSAAREPLKLTPADAMEAGAEEGMRAAEEEEERAPRASATGARQRTVFAVTAAIVCLGGGEPARVS